MLTVTMLSRFKRSFSKDNEGQIFSATSERRSYLNVREFLDDLDVRSTVSNVQSEYGRKKSNKKRLSSRKSSILNIFSQVNNKFSDRGNGSSSFNCNGLRSVSMVIQRLLDQLSDAGNILYFYSKPYLWFMIHRKD